MGAILAILFILGGILFCLWVVVRMASYHSRIGEQYRLKNKNKKGKK